MKLTGDQYSRLEQALIKAYPDRAKLGRMVRITFEKSLSEIAEGANHTERVDQLIEWAESKGKVVDLIRGAHRRSPSNEQLRSFCQAHCRELLEDVVEQDNFSNLKLATILAFTHLPFTPVLTDQVIAAGRLVLPEGGS